MLEPQRANLISGLNVKMSIDANSLLFGIGAEANQQNWWQRESLPAWMRLGADVNLLDVYGTKLGGPVSRPVHHLQARRAALRLGADRLNSDGLREAVNVGLAVRIDVFEKFVHG
jgi:hypothetical protein